MAIILLIALFAIMLFTGVLFEVLSFGFYLLFGLFSLVFNFIGFLIYGIVSVFLVVAEFFVLLISSVVEVVCGFVYGSYRKLRMTSLGEIFFPKVRKLGSGEYREEIWNFLVEKTGSEEEASCWLDERREDYPGTVRRAVYNGYGRLVWLDLMDKEQKYAAVNPGRRV